LGADSKSHKWIGKPKFSMKYNNAKSRFYLLNARAKSSMESLIPIDNMIPPRAGAYSSLDTLQKFKIHSLLVYKKTPKYIDCLGRTTHCLCKC
jgi:hypothetical protein